MLPTRGVPVQSAENLGRGEAPSWALEDEDTGCPCQAPARGRCAQPPRSPPSQASPSECTSSCSVTRSLLQGQDVLLLLLSTAGVQPLPGRLWTHAVSPFPAPPDPPPTPARPQRASLPGPRLPDRGPRRLEPIAASSLPPGVGGPHRGSATAPPLRVSLPTLPASSLPPACPGLRACTLAPCPAAHGPRWCPRPASGLTGSHVQPRTQSSDPALSPCLLTPLTNQQGC